MISLTNYFSSLIDDLGHRLIKVAGMYGTLTADQCMPFGDDSCPVQGMDAIYAETASDETPVIIGYIGVNMLAGEGEKRRYSLKKNDDGTYSVAFYDWMHSDGTYEIGGTDDNLLRYEALNTALQLHITKLETQLTEIADGIIAGGGTYTPGDISLDISASKINEIKCL